MDYLYYQVGVAEQDFKRASDLDKGQLDENELKAVGIVGEGPGVIKNRMDAFEAFNQTFSKMENLYDAMTEKKTA